MAQDIAPTIELGRAHARRLRDIHRSAGWPTQDSIEVELLAAGLLRQDIAASGAVTLRLSDAGITHLAHAFAHNRRVRDRHEALVDLVATQLLREGRIVWTDLSLRSRVTPDAGSACGTAWRVCMPDVFSIRNTTVASYLEPVVHEIKVNRADLLGDLKLPHKRESYLNLGGQCWYVLGQDARGRAIGEPDEVPLECGVLLADGDRLVLARHAPKRACADLPFSMWMALAKATPRPSLLSAHCEQEPAQATLQDAAP